MTAAVGLKPDLRLAEGLVDEVLLLLHVLRGVAHRRRGRGRTRDDQQLLALAQDALQAVRLEQLYPFPHKAFEAEVKRYPNATQVIWCQDEPQNQGYWFFVQHHIEEALKATQKLAYAGRPPSASPAVGYYDKHYAQQKDLLEAALGTARAKARKAS